MKKLFFINISYKNRIRVNLDIIKGKVKDLVVQFETFFNNKWQAVVRYNYSHGFPHRDLIFYKGKKIKEEIHIEDLSALVNIAIDDIKQNWKSYLRRCGYA